MVPGQAILARRHVLGPGDRRDDAAARGDQVLDGGAGALDVVDVDVAHLDAARRPSADDHRDAPTSDGLGQRVVAVEADQEGAIDVPAVR